MSYITRIAKSKIKSLTERDDFIEMSENGTDSILRFELTNCVVDRFGKVEWKGADGDTGEMFKYYTEQLRFLNAKNKKLKVDVNVLVDLRCSDGRWSRFWNGLLTCVIIGFVFWTATHICQS